MAIDTQDIAIESGERFMRTCEHETELVGGVVGAIGLETLWRTAGESSTSRVVAEFAAEHDSPGRARWLIVGALAEWGCDTALLRDAAIVASELATNAVLHARSPFSISVQLGDSHLRLAVGDGCPLSVAARDGGMSPRPTHGLGLIETLSARWGIEGSPRGKVVWAELSTRGDMFQSS